MGTHSVHADPVARSPLEPMVVNDLPLWRIIACTVAMCGVQVCYAAQVNQGTPELLLLGLSERLISLAWLAGPLSGLIVQPLVGLASDGCASSLGRRRPFLIAGTILSSAALLLFSNVKPLAELLGNEALALPLAICAFFLLDFSIQAVQAPLRALVTDVIPKSQRALANSYLGVFTGVGIFIGSLLTSLDLKAFFPVFRSNVQALFALAMVVLIVTIAVCVYFTSEVPLGMGRAYFPVSDSAENESLPENANRPGEDSRGIFDALRSAPRPFWQVFAVQLCTWGGFFCLFVYVNAWVGRNVFLGDGTASPDSDARKTFEVGVRFGGKSNAIMSLVILGYSLFLPCLLRFGIIPVYAFSQLIEAACLLVAPLIRGTLGQDYPSLLLRGITLVDIGAFGVVWATTMAVPWTLIGNALESDPWYSQRIGLFQTIFNASQSFPQLVVAVAIAPGVLSVANNDPAFVLFAGGICAVIGAVLVIALRVDQFDIRNVQQIAGREKANNDEDEASTAIA